MTMKTLLIGAYALFQSAISVAFILLGAWVFFNANFFDLENLPIFVALILVLVFFVVIATPTLYSMVNKTSTFERMVKGDKKAKKGILYFFGLVPDLSGFRRIFDGILAPF